MNSSSFTKIKKFVILDAATIQSAKALFFLFATIPEEKEAFPFIRTCRQSRATRLCLRGCTLRQSKKGLLFTPSLRNAVYVHSIICGWDVSMTLGRPTEFSRLWRDVECGPCVDPCLS